MTYRLALLLACLLCGCQGQSYELLTPPYRVQLCDAMDDRDLDTFTAAAHEWNTALGFDAYVIVTEDPDVTVCVVPGFQKVAHGPIGHTVLDVYPVRIEYQPFQAHNVATHELGHVAGIGHLASGCMKVSDPTTNDVTDVDVAAFWKIWGGVIAHD